LTRLIEDLERQAQGRHVRSSPGDERTYDNEFHQTDALDEDQTKVLLTENSPGGTPSAQLTNPFSHHAPRYVADSSGRPWYLGVSSNWAFNRRVLEIVHERLTGVHAPTDNLSFDGTLYELGWNGERETAGSQHLVPSADYAMFLINAVKFHCGQMFHLFDETTFMQGFKNFYDSPADADTHSFWYIHFLLILAFGKAFVARKKMPRKAPGSELFVQAVKLMPDIVFLIEQPVQAIEILCCKALYLQCLDFRCAAYNVIGQALRITLEQGMQTDMRNQGLDELHVERCLNVFWTVYILDRQMSSLMGVPLALKDSEISTPLPTFAGAPQKSMALQLHVRLSKTIAQILNTVYGSEGRLTKRFIQSTKSSLKSIAEVTVQLRETFEELRGQNSGGVSRLAAHLDLLHHQCVVVTTRPLLFSLLNKRFDEPSGISSLIKSSSSAKALLQMCVESSQHIVAVLDRLKDQSLLESFLPFDLEAASAGSMLILIAPILDADLLSSSAPWLDILYSVLDEMVAQGQVQASKRKEELQRLQQVFEQLPLPLTETQEVQQHAPLDSGQDGGNVYSTIPGNGLDDFGFMDDAIWRTDLTAEQLMAVADSLDLDGFEWMTTVSSGLGND
jgi:proline utilization trans-activator